MSPLQSALPVVLADSQAGVGDFGSHGDLSRTTHHSAPDELSEARHRGLRFGAKLQQPARFHPVAQGIQPCPELRWQVGERLADSRQGELLQLDGQA